MVAIAKSGVPSFSSLLVPQKDKLTGHVAGEALAAGDACRIGTDGKVYRSSGAAADANAKVRGFAAQETAINEAVTLIMDANWRYGAGLTPGANVFLDTAAGGLNDAATVGGTAPIGFVIDATRIRLWAGRY